MKQRNAFRGTSWEALEDRKLLTGAAGAVSLARLQQRMALIAAQNQPGRLALLARVNKAVPQGTISTASTAQVGASALQQPTRLTLQPRASTNLATAPIGVPTTTASTTAVSLKLQPVTRGLLPSSFDTVGQGGYGRLKAGAYPSQSALLASGALKTTVISSGAFPVANPAPIPPATDTVPAAGTSAASTLVPVQPAVIPTTALVGLDGVTLPRAQVDSLKSAVDTFAKAYTAGTDVAADKSTVDALRASLDNIDRSVWAQNHVATPESVTSLKGAVDAFASKYTSGKDQTADVAAFRTLETGLDAFVQVLMSDKAQTAAPTPGGGVTTNAAGDLVVVRGPAPMPMPPGGPGLKFIEMGLLTGPALTKDEVTALKAAVYTFASAYTSGTNAAADRSAAEALAGSIATLVSDRWQAMPAPDLTVAPPVSIALPAVPADALATGTSTSTSTSTVTAQAVTASTPVVPAGTVSTIQLVAGGLVSPNQPLPGSLGAALAALRTNNLFSTTTAKFNGV